MELYKFFTVYPTLMYRIFNNYEPPEELAHLNRTQIKTLVILYSNPNCSMSQISRHMNLQKGSFTTVTSSLLELGYVEKRRDTGDKRSFKLILTQSGKEIAEMQILKAENHLKKEFSKIPDKYYQKFIEAMEDLYHIGNQFKE